MQREDFTEAAPGNFVRTPEGALAFVPDPLPPALSASWELMTLVARATGALQQLAGVAHTLPNENLLIRPFLQREAVMSSRIEGTQTSLSQLILLEADEDEGNPDSQEVSNYVEALDYGLDRLSTLPVSLPLICEVHERLMRGVRGSNKAPGQFRKQQAWIGGATPHAARFVPPPTPEMAQALDALEKYLHAPSDIPFLVRLACIHYQFEAIHPFLDGNGRAGRLMLSLLLCAEGLLPRPLLYLSGYFERHRRAYYDGLLAVSQKGEWLQWVTFFLRGVVVQSQDAAARARRLLSLRETFRRDLQSSGATATTLRLVDELFIVPAINAARAQKKLEISKRTARQAIERLVADGILQEVTGRQRNRIFLASAIMDIVDAPEDETL